MKKLFLLFSVAILTLSPQDSKAQFFKELGRSIRNSYKSYSNTSSSNRGLSSEERRIREEQENRIKEYEFNQKWKEDTIRNSKVIDYSSKWVRSVDKSMLIEQNTENELGWELKYLTDGFDKYVEGKNENGDFVFFKKSGEYDLPIGSWQITKSNGIVAKFDLESFITTFEYPNGSKIELDAKCRDYSLGCDVKDISGFIRDNDVSDYVEGTLLGEFAKVTTSTGKVIDIRGLHPRMLKTYLENVRIGKLNYYFDLITGELVYSGQCYNGKVYSVPESDEIISVDNGKVTMKSGDFYEYGLSGSGPRTYRIKNAKITRNGYTWIVKLTDENKDIISMVCRDSLGGIFKPQFESDEVYNKYKTARDALEKAGVIRGFTTNWDLPKVGYKSAHEDFYKSCDFIYFCENKFVNTVNNPLVKDEIIPLFGCKIKPGGVICYIFEGKEYTEAEVQSILDKVEAEKAAEEKAKAAQDLKIYNANCQKYGKKYVDAIKPIVGMPEEWMLKKFHVECGYDSGTVKRYTMYNIFGNPFGSVWTRDGRVTSVSTW